ncbi:FKBP-type peptidyl-prolyl cis-trans isomerase [Fulvivirga sp. 29W222]|uniref:Peptidyl-prolyl cis-trans isomerase n=1 Tax=Fulvivirga marina TaxID=2494733 RepID=A0A937FYK0_9BACT|nr:FKBP-type peptidyl-prolyl cis-trans isomerase [Fulvivirga marina]MBL6446841.1 FKBP-type peptidyl-prolyl cis-trans isomerase [Fulvivirga marina]
MNRYLIYLVTLLVIAGSVFSCSDDDEQGLSVQEQFEKETAEIDQYLTENGIKALVDSASGLRYVLKNDTISEHPQPKDVIVFNYAGRFLSDEVFEEGDSLEVTLGSLIPGFQRGLQLFSEGTSGTLFIQSYYGYGKTGQGPVPPNTPLIFEVDLIEVK